MTELRKDDLNFEQYDHIVPQSPINFYEIITTLLTIEHSAPLFFDQGKILGKCADDGTI